MRKRKAIFILDIYRYPIYYIDNQYIDGQYINSMYGGGRGRVGLKEGTKNKKIMGGANNYYKK